MNIIVHILLTVRLRHGEPKWVPKRHRTDVSAGAKTPMLAFWIQAFNHSCCSGENCVDNDKDHHDGDVVR